MKERITAYVLSVGFVLLIVALPAYLHNRDAEKYMSGQRVLNVELMEENAKRTAIEVETNCNIAPVDKTNCAAAIKADAKAGVEYETAAAMRELRARQR